MSENNTADWTVGVKFVQFRKNSSFNAGIKQSPYATLFGIEARIGLTSSSLPHDVIQKLQTEDDLLAILSSNSTQHSTSTRYDSTSTRNDSTSTRNNSTSTRNNSTSIRNNSTSTRNDSTNEQHRQEQKACNSRKT